MDRDVDPESLFARERPRLRALAYRMLGTMSEAEDAVQECWLRWRDAPHAELETPEAWLTTVLTRLCVDVLRSARVRREQYVGPWLPEPIAERLEAPRSTDPSELSLAFLVVLESLSPLERAVFLLSEVFDYSFAEVALALDRSESACRKLAERARAHVREHRPRKASSREAHERALLGFLTACATGDVAGLSRMLAEDARATTDSGGHVRAARKVVHGRDRVARFLVGVSRHASEPYEVRVAEVNGTPAVLLFLRGALQSVLTLETDGEVIYSIQLVLNPEKLERVRAALEPSAPTS